MIVKVELSANSSIFEIEMKLGQLQLTSFSNRKVGTVTVGHFPKKESKLN